MEYRIATAKDIDLLMSSRLEMLKVVNGLPQDYQYDDVIVNESRDNAYVLSSDRQKGTSHERLHKE